MAKRECFRAEYDLSPEVVLDLLQQAMTAMPTVIWHQLAEGADRVDFKTSFTLTSWGAKMSAAIEPTPTGGSILTVSGEPRVGMLSNPWGEEVHASMIQTQLLAGLDGLAAMAAMNPLLVLEADHRRVEALFTRIAAAEEERSGPVQELLDALRVHMELEETYVYPLVHRSMDARLAAEAMAEHDLARDGIAQLEALSPDEPGFEGALTMVVAGIEHHVAEEEREVFPALTLELGRDGLADLAEQLTAARAELLAERPHPAPRHEKRTERANPERQTTRARTARSAQRRAVDATNTTRAELVARARKAGVAGYSQMTKAELANALS